MTSKHTPRAWQIDPLNCWRIQDSSGLAICSLLGNRANTEANALLIAEAPTTAAERDSLKEILLDTAKLTEILIDERDILKAINAELLAALDHISQMQRDKCENADADTLYMLLDNKVSIALAAIAWAKEQSS